MAADMADTVKKSLTATTSFSVSVSTRNSGILVLKAGNGEVPATRTFSVYIKVWEWTWEFYLYDIQHLSLKYEKKEAEYSGPTCSERSSSQGLRPGLATVIPERGKTPIVLADLLRTDGRNVGRRGRVHPDDPNAQRRRVSELTKPFPVEGTPKEMKSLAAYAKLAFPYTPEEKKAAKQVRPSTRPDGATGGRRRAREDYDYGPTTRSGRRSAAAKKSKATRSTRKTAAKKATHGAPKRAKRHAVVKKANSKEEISSENRPLAGARLRHISRRWRRKSD